MNAMMLLRGTCIFCALILLLPLYAFSRLIAFTGANDTPNDESDLRLLHARRYRLFVRLHCFQKWLVQKLDVSA